ncbi:MAG: hypothetical protein BWY74_01805 [Firmicutes bacterium ADurb.Bin419]|nr:MAG: hypothetical protein BWY74_01805 [Firmicutes bacterium ADurb.Bin419]
MVYCYLEILYATQKPSFCSGQRVLVNIANVITKDGLSHLRLQKVML